jgi:DNA polymerase-1
MERHGVGLDQSLCVERERECIEQQAIIGAELNEWAGREINWASPKQKAEFFYDVKGWPVPPVCGNTRAVKRVRPGARPTDEAAVIHLAKTCQSPSDQARLRLYCGWPDIKAKEHELSWKKYEKLKGFYQGLPQHAAVDGRVHTQLAAMTRTGRLTSKNPNLQQITPRVKDVFVASPGKTFLEFDFKALELCVLAHIIAKRYDDFSLANELADGADPHQITANELSRILGTSVSRNHGKIINFSINYGKTAKGLSIQLGCSEEEAEALLEAFAEARPGVGQWLRDAVDYVRVREHCRTLLGRFIPIPEIRGDRFQRQGADRKALNYPIQGSAADIVSAAMIRCSELYNPVLRGLRCQMLLQVHDSLLFEVGETEADDATEEIEKCMVTCLADVSEFLCPLAVTRGRGARWGECK